MRTTVTIDDDLMADAATYSGVDDRSKLISLALDHYVKRMAAKRLAALGGTMPDLEVPGRRDRHPDDTSPAREAGRALGALGGTMPDLDVPDRRRLQSDAGEKPQVAEDPTDYGASSHETDDA